MSQALSYRLLSHWASMPPPLLTLVSRDPSAWGRWFRFWNSSRSSAGMLFQHNPAAGRDPLLQLGHSILRGADLSLHSLVSIITRPGEEKIIPTHPQGKVSSSVPIAYPRICLFLEFLAKNCPFSSEGIVTSSCELAPWASREYYNKIRHSSIRKLG